MTDDPRHSAPRPETMVLTGRRYQSLAATWSDWSAKTFDEACAAIAEKHKDDKAGVAPTEILEVIVVRRALVRADITVEEVELDG